MKVKKSMNVIDVMAWVSLSKDLLKGVRINNVYRSSSYWFLKISGRSGKRVLKIDPSRRVHLSLVEPSVKSIDNFTAFLRKHIRNCFIEKLSTPSFERIVYIDIGCYGKKYRLVVELLPRGVALLLHDDRILYATSYLRTRDRVIRPGELYRQPPPPTDPFKQDLGVLKKLLSKGKDLVRGIVIGWNIPGEVAEEVLYRCGLYEVKNAKPSAIADRDLESIYNSLHDLYKESVEGRGYVVRDASGRYVGFTPYNPCLYREVYGFDVVVTSDFNEAVDAYFTFLERVEESFRRERVVKEELDKIDKAISEQERVIEEYVSKSREFRELADYLALNIVSLESIVECISDRRTRFGWESVTECSGVQGFVKDRGVVEISIGGRVIDYDIRLRPRDYINRLYRLSGEYLGKAERAKKALAKLLERKRELEQAVEVARESGLKAVKPRLWFERYHWLVTSDGFLVIAGRDADQNEAIVRKYLEDKDIFMHAEIHGAPVTVIKTRGLKPSDRSLWEAAVLAACYSRGWREVFGYVDVYWVWGEQVSKTPPSGEYLGKGAFMVYGRRNYIRGVELRLAVGVEEVYDEVYGVYQRVIVGPEDLVRERALVYGLIVPNGRGVKEVSRELFKRMSELVGTLAITVDEVMYRIPGSSRVLKVCRGAREIK